MDPQRFAKIKAAFERQGGIIDQSAEARRYLDRRGANATTWNATTIQMRANPTATEVFEEFIHVGQHRRGRVIAGGPDDNRIRMEIEAAQKLIRNRKPYGIPNSETRQTIRRLRVLRTGRRDR